MPILDTGIPDFGDTIASRTGLVARRNMGGRLNVARPASWPIIDTFKFTVSAMSKATNDSLIAFILANRGLDVTLIDYSNCKWTGVVIDAPKSIQVLRGCGYEIEFVFEGQFTTPIIPPVTIGAPPGGITYGPPVYPIPLPIDVRRWPTLTIWSNLEGPQWPPLL